VSSKDILKPFWTEPIPYTKLCWWWSHCGISVIMSSQKVTILHKNSIVCFRYGCWVTKHKDN